ncbi:MAG TPA: hypothetical protein VM144_11500 [Aestuariivirga sp.]|nr:hypothetical protein [Aestuariivirga sp.]
MTNPGDFTFGRAELEAAVAKGVLDRSAADSLTEFLIQNRNAASDPDEERLRLITGFNDIFVTIGIALFLGALYYLIGYGQSGSLGVAVASWGLAEVFTKRKRMALPSIVLLVTFVLSSTNSAMHVFAPELLISDPYDGSLQGLTVGFAAIAASALHWFRFHVPITIAAFSAGLVVTAITLIAMLNENIILNYPVAVFTPLGIAAFLTAMKFDMSDRNRLTQRTDIAFWLHLLAAPLIVHSIVAPLLTQSAVGLGAAVAIVSLFAVLSLVALTVDRRALLVSSLLYLGYASSRLLSWSGVASENAGLSILIVGGTVLVLSVAWQPLRRIVLGVLPQNLRNLVPPAAA